VLKNKYIYYLSVVIGGAIAIYANASEQQNTLILILGIVFLMFGIFKIQSTIPSKKEKETFVESEPFEDEEE